MNNASINTPESPPSLERLSFTQFVESAEAWDDLARNATLPTPFMSQSWIRTWWRHFGEDREFVALVLCRGRKLVAGIPLAIRRSHFMGLPVRIAEIVGTSAVPTRGMGLTDKAEPPVRTDNPGVAAALANAVAELLHASSVTPQIDLLDLKGLDAESAFSAALARHPGTTLERSVSPFLTLSSWDEYLATRSGNFRKHLRKYQRLLEKSGRLEFARLDADVDDPASWIAQLLESDKRSWKAERGTDLFRHPAIRAFMQDVVELMSREKAIDLQFLKVNQRVLAFELCFDFAGRLYSYTGSFDRDFHKESPGTALTAEVIRSACDRGHIEYDLLRGDEGYKGRWSEQSRREIQRLIPGSRIRGKLFAACGPRLKARIKQSAAATEFADRVSGFLTRRRHGG